MTPVPGRAQSDLYRPAFVHNCFNLLVRAHRSLKGVSLSSEEEPSITGLLVQRAKDEIESETAESWMEHIEVLDDPPQNDQTDRLGKKRPRIDLEFVETGRGQRPRFHVEAKRLYRADSAGEYFGASGLGMFLTGSYASRWPSAGMLGYVQTKSCPEWRASIAARFSRNSTELRACPDRKHPSNPGWTTDGLGEVQASCHGRTPANLGPIEIFHLLLDCR